MARLGEKNLKTLDIQKNLGENRDYQTLLNLLNRLVDKDLVYKSKKGYYGFALPLFREYILRRH